MGEVFTLPLEDGGLTRPLREMLLALADHAHDESLECWPSVGFLAHKVDVHRRTIQRRLERLRALGLTERVAPATQHRPATYRLNLNWPKKPRYRASDEHRGASR